ncbi:MAG: heme-binding protein [Proteobacteria bacterium]|nr:heme-binding protein [Pseudomonadota bacterium]MBI3498131.1 heme-binding protein [Pseudomonadota bacterium]
MLAAASVIVDVALARARELALAPLTVAVLDAGGHMKAIKREDGSGIIRENIAIGKAWGALGMGFPSRALAERAAKGPQFFAALQAMSGGRVVPAAGGVLVRNGSGRLLGAVGVTGDTSDKDEECAVAGIRAAGLTAETGAA